MVFDPGCMMRSRIETVLKPGTMDGVSPSYARTTTPGHGVVSFVARGLRSFTTAAEAAANPRATALAPSCWAILVPCDAGYKPLFGTHRLSRTRS
jgi:hypothetical protein